MSKNITLEQAMTEMFQIENFFKDKAYRPFFFCVGAGISYPPIPLAGEIISQCKKIALENDESLGSVKKNQSNDAEYSFWFEKAFSQRGLRKEYLKKLIENKEISTANLRLAHFLSGGKLANIVVTTNFDDFLSRALNIFNEKHIVCDSPEIIEKIDLRDSATIQIVHIHGTYKFYDCCNLKTEIANRVVDMNLSKFMNGLLEYHSPIIIGYSGWENDIIMNSLKNRLNKPLENRLYWFCYNQQDFEKIPNWVKDNPDVTFIVPGNFKKIKGVSWHIVNFEKENIIDTNTSINEIIELVDFNLSAEEVFQSMIEKFEIPCPDAIVNPIQHQIEILKKALQLELANDKNYFLNDTIKYLEKGQQIFKKLNIEKETVLNKLREMIRTASYTKLVEFMLTYPDEDAFKTQNVLEIIVRSVENLTNNDMKIKVLDFIIKISVGNSLFDKYRCNAMVKKGNALIISGEKSLGLEIYDEIIREFKESHIIEIEELALSVFFNKGIIQEQSGFLEEALKTYFGFIEFYKDRLKSGRLIRLVQIYINYATIYWKNKDYKNALAIYSIIIEQYSGETDIYIQRDVANAFYCKINILIEKNNFKEAVSLYEQFIKMYSEISDSNIQQTVIYTVFHKGRLLLKQNKNEKAILAYDSFICNYKESKNVKTLEYVMKAYLTKGALQEKINNEEKALKTYGEAIFQYENILKEKKDIYEQTLKKYIGNILMGKVRILKRLKMDEVKKEIIDIYDNLIGNFENILDEETYMNILLNRSVLYVESDTEKALADYNYICEHSKIIMADYVGRAIYNKGGVFLLLKRYEEALKIYESFVIGFENNKNQEIKKLMGIAKNIICQLNDYNGKYDELDLNIQYWE